MRFVKTNDVLLIYIMVLLHFYIIITYSVKMTHLVINTDWLEKCLHSVGPYGQIFFVFILFDETYTQN